MWFKWTIKHSKVIVEKTGLLIEVGEQETLNLTVALKQLIFSPVSSVLVQSCRALQRLDLNIFVGLWSARHCSL